jgi:hypothetical protein
MVIAYDITSAGFFCDLGVLGGYDTAKNRASIDDEINMFVCSRDDALDESMRLWIDKTLDCIEYGKLDCTLEQFVGFRDAWGTEGVSTLGTPFCAEIQGRKVTKRSKWFSALSMTDADIIREMQKDTPYRDYPFRKSDEPAATRLVHKFDTRSIIRCCWANTALKNLNGHKEWCTIGADPKQKRRLGREAVRRDGLWRICVDQKGFDNHQQKSWILYCLEGLMERIARRNEEFRSELMKEVDLMRRSEIRIRRSTDKGGNVFKPWTGGIPSGHFWTALIDSVLNRAQFRLVCDRLGYRVVTERFQGDDSWAKVVERPSAEDIAFEYERLGLEVNPNKTWINLMRSEYLHEFYSVGSRDLWGFPSRGFRAVVWKKPDLGVTQDRTAPSILQSRLADYRRACRRGLEIIPGEIARLAPSKDDRLSEWLHTPVWMGGGGFCLTSSGDRNLERDLPGRVALCWDKEDWIVGRARLISPVIDGFNSVALLRVSSGARVPGIKRRVLFKTVCSVPTPKQERLSHLFSLEVPTGLRLRLDWNVKDVKDFPDAYRRKIDLEVALEREDRVSKDLVPGNWHEVFTDEQRSKVVKQIRKFAYHKCNFEDSMYDGTAYEGVARWANAVWGGFVNYVALEGMLWMLRPGWEALLLIAWRRVLELDPFRVAV